MKQIIISTDNKNKVREISHLLSDLDVKVLTKTEAGYGLIHPVEDASTLEGNARKKVEKIGKPKDIVLGDDTGLFVSALPGELGVHSARYAGESANDEANRKKLLSAMKDKADRSAYFKTVIVIKYKNRLYSVTGVCKGEIIDDLKGDNGFGYDPMFKPLGSDKTFAEMSEQEKNLISHRAKALVKAKALLKELI